MRRSVSASIVLVGLLGLGACARDEVPAPAREPAAPAASTAPAPREKVAPPRPAQLQRVTIKALGMYCEESCPIKVRYALAEFPSIYELGFDLSNESIFLSYDATLGTPKDVTKPMLAAIKKTGFDPWLAKASWPEGAAASVQVVMREPAR